MKRLKKYKKYFDGGPINIDSTLTANKNVPFVDRILNGDKYPVRFNSDPKTDPKYTWSTHVMSSGEADGNYYAYPTIRYIPNSKKWIDSRNNPKALNIALEDNDVIKFKTSEDADYFSQHYKDSKLSKVPLHPDQIPKNPKFGDGGKIDQFPALKSSINQARDQGQFDIGSPYYKQQLQSTSRLATGEVGTPMIDPIDLVTGIAGTKFATKELGELSAKELEQIALRNRALQAEKLSKEMNSYHIYTPDKSYGKNIAGTRATEFNNNFNRRNMPINNTQVIKQAHDYGPGGGGQLTTEPWNYDLQRSNYMADDKIHNQMWNRIIETPSKNAKGGVIRKHKHHNSVEHIDHDPSESYSGNAPTGFHEPIISQGGNDYTFRNGGGIRRMDGTNGSVIQTGPNMQDGNFYTQGNPGGTTQGTNSNFGTGNYIQAGTIFASEAGRNGNILQTSQGGPSTSQKVTSAFGPWGQAIGAASTIGTNATIGPNKSNFSNAIGTGVFDPVRQWNSLSDHRMNTGEKALSMLNPFAAGFLKSSHDKQDLSNFQYGQQVTNTQNERDQYYKNQMIPQNSFALGGEVGSTLINIEGASQQEVTPATLKKGELLVKEGKLLKTYTAQPRHPLNGINPNGNVVEKEGGIIIPTKHADNYKKSDKLFRLSLEHNLKQDQMKIDTEIPKEMMGKGGEIHIKPSHVGRFTAYKKRTSQTTEEALHSSNPHVRAMANFARNSAKWKKEDGGPIKKYEDGGGTYPNYVQDWNYQNPQNPDYNMGPQFQSGNEQMYGINQGNYGDNLYKNSINFNPISSSPGTPNYGQTGPRLQNGSFSTQGNPNGTTSSPNGRLNWGEIGTQAGLGIASNIGPLMYLAQNGRKFDHVNYVQVNPNLLDPTADLQQANIDERMAAKDIASASGGNSGSYLSNRIGLNTSSTFNKFKIRSSYNNLNSDIKNKFSMYNKELDIKGQEATAQNKGQAYANYYNAINQIGKNVTDQYRANQEENAVDYVYPGLRKYSRFKKYKNS